MFFISPRKQKINLLWQIILIFILPVLLIVAGVLSFEYRLVLLSIITVIVLGIALKEKISFENFGLKKIWFLKPFIIYGAFTLVVCLFITIFAYFSRQNLQLYALGSFYFLIGSVLRSVAQEIVYRGFLMYKLKQALKNRKFLIIFINALLFALIHIIYPMPFLFFISTFILGLGFAGIYYKYPNLIAISISHSIINFVGVLYFL